MHNRSSTISLVQAAVMTTTGSRFVPLISNVVHVTRLATETVESTALSLESVDNVE